VHYDRVVWTTTPDAGTGVAALQTGEQDWQETTPHDLLPVIKAAGDIDTRILDPRGYACMLRLNHLQPPFDNPAIRRALLGAIDQSAFMTAVAGTDPAFQVSPIGYFAPGTPMASEVGLDVFRGPRDYAKVKADLKAAGYNGEKIVLLVPTNSLAQKPLGEIAVDSLRKAGMNVEYAGLDFAVVLQRQLKKDPIGQGGWSAAVGNWQGIDWLNPAGNTNIRGEGKVAGWYASEKMGALRSQWLAASELAEQQRICRQIQAVAFEEIPYIPIGLYKQPTAYRKAITGILDGTAVFWNVRPA
jgi:peptide/nickel transport system substrate-binding protein